METFSWLEFWKIFLGDISIACLAAYFTYFMIGAIIHFAWKLGNREKSGRTVPKKFKWKFLIKDNLLRWLGVILLIFVNIRFFEDIYSSPLTPFLALGLGYSIDSIIGNGKRSAEGGLAPLNKAKKKLVDKYNKD